MLQELPFPLGMSHAETDQTVYRGRNIYPSMIFVVLFWYSWMSIGTVFIGG